MTQHKIAVIGLGYVGLPLAVHLAKHYHCIGFDVNCERINELKSGFDRTAECSKDALNTSSLTYSSNAEDIKPCNIYIITVPTPITDDKQPDLMALRNASKTVGAVLSKGDIVVYESTVYPGVTEDFCAPILEEASNLTAGIDFTLGYSPERINPGDTVHTVDKITKIVSGQTKETTQTLATIYGSVNNNNIHIAPNIKTAEAAKVIENTQRDINIAFINEITSIFSKIGISIYDVLEASATKWNFLNFRPGLVGGHCIGVDPYYLASLAQKLGEEPRIILSGRRINERMSDFIAREIHRNISKSNAKIVMLGITFKENVPDLRNSKAPDLIKALEFFGHEVTVVDPLANAQEALDYYGITTHSCVENLSTDYDCVVGCVSHDAFTNFKPETFKALLTEDSPLIFDIKKMWSEQHYSADIRYASL